MSTATALRAAATGQPQQGPEPRSPYEALKRKLEASRDSFLPLMGGNQANVDAFIRVVLNAVMANPDLLHADQRTLLASCMKAAQDGLMPDGRESVLNIYSTKTKGEKGEDKWIDAVQYLPMVGGLIKLLYLSGEVTLVDASVVYQAEVDEGKFRWVRGDKPRLEHEPTGADAPGPLYAAYCCITLKSGEIKREVMFRRDIAKVKAASKAGNSPNAPWNKWEDQQWIKSVIKRAYKQVPHSERLTQADRSDNEAMGYVEMQGATEPTVRAVAPALTHQPAEAFDFSVGARQREHVTVGNASANDEVQAGQRRAEVPSFNVAAFTARVDACTTTDGLDILSDDVRSIEDPAVRQTLEAVINARSAKLDQPTGTPSVQAARAPRRAAGSMPDMG